LYLPGGIKLLLRIRVILATALALLVTAGMMPSQAFAAVIRSTYIVQTTAAGQDAVLKSLFGMGEVPLDQLDFIMDGFTVPLTDFEASVLAADPNVISVQQDQQMSLLDSETPTPSWGLDRIDQQTATPDSTYNYPTDGGKGVRVYVLDTGVMATNPEFDGRILTGFDALGQNLQGADCHGHGTHVAGTIAGTKFGVAKAATIVPVRVLACSGAGFTSSILTALDWVLANNPAGTPAVMSMSIGGPLQPLLNAGIKKLYDGGILPIVAAGNSSDDACRYSPSSTPDAVTVGASDPNDVRAYFSNFGDCVDIFAPGTNIVSASATNPAGSATMSGTSMATPHVSGVAALYLAQHPAASPAQVAKALKDNGILNAVNNAQSQFGNILLNNNFVRGAAPVTPNPNPILNAPDQVASLTASAIGANSATVNWVDGASNGGSPITGHIVRALAAGATSPITYNAIGGGLSSFTMTGLSANTNYTFSVYAYNVIGSGKVSAGVMGKTLIGAPTAPANVSVAPGATTAGVTWTLPNDGGSPLTSFSIELFSSAAPRWTVVGTTTNTAYTLTGLTSAATYIVRIKAINALGTSYPSTSLSFTTVAGNPDVPTGLSISNVNIGGATASWNPVASTSPTTPVTYVLSYGVEGSTVVYTLPASLPTAAITGLISGRNYFVSVRAQVGTAVSGESTRATFTTLATTPSTPTGVTVSGVAGSQVLRWQQPVDGGSTITSYIIQASSPLASATAPVDAWTTFATAAASDTSISLPAAPVAKYVRYRVIAKNAIGESAPSLSVAITTAPVAPSAPASLVATAPNSAGVITLSWSAPTSDGGSPLSGYTILVNRDGKTWNVLSSVAPSTLSFVTSQPIKGQTWIYAVSARNAAGASLNSNSVTISTATSVPGAVSSAVALTGTNDVTVRWAPPQDNGGLAITGYRVEQQIAGVWSTLAEVQATTTSYTVPRALPGVLNSFRISAANSVGYGSVSSVMSILTPYVQATAPQNFTAVYNGATKRVDTTWAAPAALGGGAVSQYVLQYSKDAGVTWLGLTTVPATASAMSVTAPAKAQVFTYRVVAVTQFGMSVPSSNIVIAIAATLPSQVAGPSVLLSGASDVTVRWSVPSDNGGIALTGFILERQVNGVWETTSQLSATTLSYTTPRALPGVMNVFRVSATNALGSGAASVATAVMTPYLQASAPLNFTASDNSAMKRVDFSFESPTDLGGSVVRNYYIQISRDGGLTWVNQASVSALTGFTVEPPKGQTWSYRAVANTGFGLSLPSSPVAISTPLTVPSASVAQIALTGTTDVTIRWSAPADNGGTAVTGYLLERQANGGWETVADLPATTVTYSAARALPGAYSIYRVTAKNSVGSSLASANVGVMTPFVQATEPRSFTAAYIASTNRVNVSFLAPSYLGGGAVAFYQLQVSTNGGLTWSGIVNLTASTLAYAAAAPAKGGTANYRVVASTQAGLGLPSASVAVSVPLTVSSAPTAATGAFATDGSVNLTWAVPSDSGGTAITGYKLQRLDAAGTTWLDAQTLGATTLSANVARDLPGVRASWRIIAVNSVGLSAASAVITYLIPAIHATAVQNLAVKATSLASSVQVTFTDAATYGGSALNSFYIYVSRDGGATWLLIANTRLLAVTVAAPTKGSTWQYRVVAMTAFGAGASTAPVSYTTN